MIVITQCIVCVCVINEMAHNCPHVINSAKDTAQLLLCCRRYWWERNKIASGGSFENIKRPWSPQSILRRSTTLEEKTEQRHCGVTMMTTTGTTRRKQWGGLLKSCNYYMKRSVLYATTILHLSVSFSALLIASLHCIVLLLLNRRVVVLTIPGIWSRRDPQLY